MINGCREGLRSQCDLLPCSRRADSLKITQVKHVIEASGLTKRFGDVTALDDLTLDVPLERAMGHLSTGNRRKVGLVSALMHEPDLVLLDEPTAGLDPLVQVEIRLLLGELRDAGTTVFLSTHSLREVELVADRVAIIRQGGLVFDGSMNDLVTVTPGSVTVRFATEIDVAAARRHKWFTEVTPSRVRFTNGPHLDLALRTALALGEVVSVEHTAPELAGVVSCAAQ
ncbi:MAG: ABC-2 type transport system ATP-binding protein [Candidatus Poriferisodalaceae bacterium]|jgi:ABC-2 type transport system ATP-binding protein